MCEDGCQKWFHRECLRLRCCFVQISRSRSTGMSHEAYDLLTASADAVWVCDKCANPSVKVIVPLAFS